MFILGDIFVKVELPLMALFQVNCISQSLQFLPRDATLAQYMP